MLRLIKQSLTVEIAYEGKTLLRVTGIPGFVPVLATATSCPRDVGFFHRARFKKMGAKWSLPQLGASSILSTPIRGISVY